MATALITGATAGIGWAFAKNLAQKNYTLIIHGRDEQRLGTGSEELRRLGARRVSTLPADLATDAGIEAVAARTELPNYPVDLLINNAGFGARDGFLDDSLRRERELLTVHCEAVLRVSHAAARAMVSRGHGTIITVSSIASFFSGGTYSAAKAWSRVFSESLHAELDGTGVTATALCPGLVRTEFHERSGQPTEGIPGWAWLNADDVVATALRDAFNGAAVSVPSPLYKALSVVAPLTPQRAVAAVMKQLR